MTYQGPTETRVVIDWQTQRPNRITLPAMPEPRANRGPVLVTRDGKCLKRLAHPKGFEPLASAFGGQGTG